MAVEQDRPINEVRRRDKAVTDEGWIKAFLHSGAWGALASVAEGQPFIHTNLYVYDEDAHVIYLHTAREGRTRSNLERDRRACFSVAEMGRVLPDQVAAEFSVEYAGVTVFGRGFVVEDDEEKAHGLQLLTDKYAPHLQAERDYRPANQEELDRTSVLRIEIESWSGKKNEKRADFPGAYRYDEHRRASPFSPGDPGQG
ncbi:MAG: pyridoxamine 5'-phosphate oxidase family protein [Gemmatimonadales bacterium]|jgi:nitroimidazol reductase NimA-like FMN-containing flavoprotein (pyridoxamine 5'-phosphate oxidase superfamily)